MKAEIDRNGIMHTMPQTELEVFAVTKWCDNKPINTEKMLIYMQTEEEAKNGN